MTGVVDRAVEAIDAAIARIRELERQNADLQAANNRLLERARRAEDALKTRGSSSLVTQAALGFIQARGANDE